MQALTYPTILLVAGFAAMYIIMTRALPQFATLYEGSDREMPLLTRIVVSVSNWLGANGVYLTIALLGIVVAVWLASRNERGAAALERLWRRLPLVGRLWALQNQNIFARVMRLLLAGGVPLPEAMTITAGAVPGRVVRDEIERAQKDLVTGGSLQDAIEKHCQFDETVGEMIRIGEGTGGLDEMFGYLAEAGEEQAEDLLELISNLVAPLVLLLIGLTIALMVVAMYLPMFGSYSALAD